MSAPVKEGDILAGKYRVDKVLGIGGMGVVVAAHHIHLDEKVAIKFLLPELLGNREAIARFTREARAAVKIKSDHVARVSDVGNLDNGAPYMVMEYLEGADLGAWLEQNGRLPVEQAVEFVLHACEAIAEAHALGIVHRDLKPANLFVTRGADGLSSVKVLDFGISKVSHFGGSGPDMAMTKTSAVMGSPYYMSPEQLESAKSVDARSDLWALGVILYELLTNKLPFAADAFPELVLKIVRDEPEPLSKVRPDLPAALEAIVAKCLQKDRAKRYPNVAELALALRPFAPRRSRESVERIHRVIQNAGLSASALALPPSSDPKGESFAPPTQASWGNTAPGSVRGRRPVVLAFVGAAVIASGVGVYVARGRLSSVEPPSAVGGAGARAMDQRAVVPSFRAAAEPAPPASLASAGLSPARAAPASSSGAAEPAPVISPVSPPAAQRKGGVPRKGAVTAESVPARPPAPAPVVVPVSSPPSGGAAPAVPKKPNVYNDRK